MTINRRHESLEKPTHPKTASHHQHVGIPKTMPFN